MKIIIASWVIILIIIIIVTIIAKYHAEIRRQVIQEERENRSIPEEETKAVRLPNAEEEKLFDHYFRGVYNKDKNTELIIGGICALICLFMVGKAHLEGKKSEMIVFGGLMIFSLVRGFFLEKVEDVFRSKPIVKPERLLVPVTIEKVVPGKIQGEQWVEIKEPCVYAKQGPIYLGKYPYQEMGENVFLLIERDQKNTFMTVAPRLEDLDWALEVEKAKKTYWNIILSLLLASQVVMFVVLWVEEMG